MSRWSDAGQMFRYLEAFTNLERSGYKPREYRLERMEQLLARFDAPHGFCDVIHVAGSKGKGSVATFAAHCCAATGLRVGLYTSPHVSDYRERIAVLGPGGEPVAMDGVLLECADRIADHVDELRVTHPESTLPTTFELLTLLAFLTFRAAGCQVAVLEVGLGGRLDATNLVIPRVSVITRIELEHTDYLGPDIPSIAREKAGIIKRGIPVVVGEQRPEAEAEIRRIAAERNAPLIHPADEVTITSETVRITGVSVKHAPGEPGAPATSLHLRFTDGMEVRASLRLLGAVQSTNAALAAVATRIALPGITAEALEAGLARAWLPGRAEMIPGMPAFLLDGAHTPESVRRALDVAVDLEPDPRRRALIFGSVLGKQHQSMLELVAGEFRTIIISRPGTFKKSNPPGLLEMCRAAGGNCELLEEMEDAVAAAAASGAALVLVTGSFHLVGEARRVLLARRPADASVERRRT